MVERFLNEQGYMRRGTIPKLCFPAFQNSTLPPLTLALSPADHIDLGSCKAVFLKPVHSEPQTGTFYAAFHIPTGSKNVEALSSEYWTEETRFKGISDEL